MKKCFILFSAAFLACGCSAQSEAGRIRRIPGPNGDDCLVLSNRFGEAEVSLYGAQIRRYDPAGQVPVLFSPTTSKAFGEGGTVFGGVPYCWPWFNMNGEAQTEGHGFANHSTWRVKDSASSDDVVEVRLTLESTPETKEVWPYDFSAVYTIRLSNRLELDFSTKNTGEAAFDITEGFHCYFNVADVENTVLKGFDGAWVDTVVPDATNYVYRGDYRCDGNLNEVFFNPGGPVEIVDSGNGRSIFVWSRMNAKVILWNPGPDFHIPELGLDDWRHIVCVEPATISRECATRIMPGKTHEIRMTVQSVPGRK